MKNERKSHRRDKARLVLTDTMNNVQNPFIQLFKPSNQRTETYLFVFLKKKHPKWQKY